MKSKKINRYTDIERLSILRNHFETGSSRAATARKYNLATPSLINSWIKRFRFEELELSSDCKYSQEMKKKQETPIIESSLQSRIRELERALAYSKLEVLALNTLIDVAEKEEEIAIRKKSGAKQ